MKDYPPLPDGLPRVLSASSALTACPDSVCPVLDAPELEQLTGSSDRWIAGRLRRLPLRNEDNEPRRIRDLSAGYAEQGFELRRLGARLLLADGVTSVAEARAAVLGGRQTGLPVMICVELDDEGCFASGEDCRTRVPGVFVAGDCRAKTVRQLTTAVGDGAVAGLAAVRYLENN